MSNQTAYIPTTFADAKLRGTKTQASINNIEYTGYSYEGYFFYHLKSIGYTKILIKHCKNVQEVLE